MSIHALNRAIEVAEGQTALADALNRIAPDRKTPFRQSHVWTWLRRDKKVPPEVAILIDQALSGQVTKSELRPDIFGEPPQTA